MPRQLSAAAAAAKAIRTQLKAASIPARATSDNFSGGNSVTVTLLGDPMPATVEAVKQGLAKYQYGEFDAMTDCYEYTNKRSDVPQTKYLTINIEYSPELEQRAWDYLRANQSGWDHLPADFSALKWNDCRDEDRLYQQPAQVVVREVMTGTYDKRLASPGCGFWTQLKPRQRAA